MQRFQQRVGCVCRSITHCLVGSVGLFSITAHIANTILAALPKHTLITKEAVSRYGSLYFVSVRALHSATTPSRNLASNEEEHRQSSALSEHLVHHFLHTFETSMDPVIEDLDVSIAIARPEWVSPIIDRLDFRSTPIPPGPSARSARSVGHVFVSERRACQHDDGGGKRTLPADGESTARCGRRTDAAGSLPGRPLPVARPSHDNEASPGAASAARTAVEPVAGAPRTQEPLPVGRGVAQARPQPVEAPEPQPGPLSVPVPPRPQAVAERWPSYQPLPPSLGVAGWKNSQQRQQRVFRYALHFGRLVCV